VLARIKTSKSKCLFYCLAKQKT